MARDTLSIARGPRRRGKKEAPLPRVPNAQTVSGHALALERAKALYGAGRSVEARGVCETILTGDPAHREALYVLGIIHARSKDFAAALPVFQVLTTLDPSHAGGWFHRGMALIGLERFEEAADSLYRMTSARPDDAMGHFWHGFALTCLGRYGAAAPVLARAHALAPDHAEIHLSHATTLLWTGKAGEAMRHYKTLAHRHPASPPVRFSEGVAHLLLGEYAEGLPLHEWRAKLGNNAARPEFAASSRWSRAAEHKGKIVLLHGDGGLGDAIQFCRYAPLIAAAGAEVRLVVPDPLVRLLRGLPGIGGISGENAPLPPFDVHCPLMSLPHAFGATLETIPATVPYLWPRGEAVEMWKTRLAGLPGTRVGLVWAAGARSGVPIAEAFSRRKSMTLAALAPLAAVPGINFVSLQLGPEAKQARHPPPGLAVHDVTDRITDFEDTAAIVANLDLVITVDTAVAHLAGAMGRPVWLMNLFDTDWRWLLDREDSPWYPTLRIFRQPASGDWASVARAVAAALRAFTPDRRGA